MTKNNFNITVNHLWKHKEYYMYEFDYPFYGGIPKRVSARFSPEVVDSIQNIWSYLIGLDVFKEQTVDNKYKTKKEFSRGLKNELARLGEKIK